MYVKVANDVVEKFPYSLAELKKEIIAIPARPTDEFLARFGVYAVVVKEIPTYQKNQTAVQDTTPTLENGVWYVGWTVRDYTPEETQEISEAFRQERNLLLKECDWTHVTDSSLSDAEKTSWAAYRQALRDVTEQPGFPFDFTWPTKPQ